MRNKLMALAQYGISEGILNETEINDLHNVCLILNPYYEKKYETALYKFYLLGRLEREQEYDSREISSTK